MGNMALLVAGVVSLALAFVFAMNYNVLRATYPFEDITEKLIKELSTMHRHVTSPVNILEALAFAAAVCKWTTKDEFFGAIGLGCDSWQNEQLTLPSAPATRRFTLFISKEMKTPDKLNGFHPIEIKKVDFTDTSDVLQIMSYIRNQADCNFERLKLPDMTNNHMILVSSLKFLGSWPNAVDMTSDGRFIEWKTKLITHNYKEHYYFWATIGAGELKFMSINRKDDLDGPLSHPHLEDLIASLQINGTELNDESYVLDLQDWNYMDELELEQFLRHEKLIENCFSLVSNLKITDVKQLTSLTYTQDNLEVSAVTIMSFASSFHNSNERLYENQEGPEDGQGQQQNEQVLEGHQNEPYLERGEGVVFLLDPTTPKFRPLLLNIEY